MRHLQRKTEMIKTTRVLALGALVVGCHLDKLLNQSSGGPHPTSTAPPVALRFMAQPRTAQVGQKITPAVQVSVVDSAGVPVMGAETTTVVMQLGANPAGNATLGGTTTAHPSRGVATFDNLWIDKPGSGYTLVAHLSGLPDTPSAPFDVNPPPPTTGSIAVTTSTSGQDLDPDGYTLTVDAASQTVAINTTVTVSNLSVANHTVALSSVASNCTVSGSASRTVAVAAGQTATVTFTVTCNPLPPTTGDLVVTATTGGSDLDPDGYTVSVAGTSQSIPTNGSVTFSGLQAGTQSVGLSGFASNCTVTNSNPMTVNVPAGGTGHADFAITCVAPQNHAPVVAAGPDQQILLSVFSLTLDQASFSDPDGPGPWTVRIDWGDGTHDTFTQQSEGSIQGSHTYPVSLLGATYQLTITVTDAGGLMGTASKTVTVKVA